MSTNLELGWNHFAPPPPASSEFRSRRVDNHLAKGLSTVSTAGGVMGKAEAISDGRSALTRNAAEKGLIEYWEAREIIENPALRIRAVPHCWHYRDMYPLLERASALVPVEHAYRRALLFQNPGLAPRPWITTTIYGGCSWYNPGESAEVHRHPPGASRFALAGDGGFTMVEGEKCLMSRGDLVITPNIWVDLLDLPTVEALRNNWSMDYEYFEEQAGRREQKRKQSESKAARYSAKLYGAGGIKPRLPSHKRGQSRGTPKFLYRWEDTLRALDDMRELMDDPCDGVSVEFVNPVTGQSVMPTMSFGVHLYKSGGSFDFQRRTGNTVFCVIEGRGRTEIDGAPALEWEKNDLFVVPDWTWYRHVNGDAKSDVLLYAVSDEPVVKALQLWRRQRRTAAGAIEELG
jgi:gentisate 1,2-dioxygenase